MSFHYVNDRTILDVSPSEKEERYIENKTSLSLGVFKDINEVAEKCEESQRERHEATKG